MKNLLKSASANENFAKFIFLEGGPENNDPVDKTKKTNENTENKKNAEAAKNTLAGAKATETNNEKLDKIMQSTEELGMAELLNKNQIEKISKDLENILQNPENIAAIKNGAIGIVVYGSASHHKINGELNYNINGQKHTVKNNWELAKLRADMAEEIARKTLADKGIYNVIIRKEIPVGETGQDGVGENDKRISGVSLFKMNNAESIVKNYTKIIIDRSGSMEDDKEIVAEAEKQGKAENLILKNKNTHGDVYEEHMETIVSQIKKLPKNSTMLIITDEKDDWGRGKFKNWQDRMKAYVEKINEVKEIAKEKNIQVVMKFINPKNPKEFVVFDFFRNNAGANMVRGKDDITTWNGLKKMQNYYAQKDEKKYNNDVASL